MSTSYVVILPDDFDMKKELKKLFSNNLHILFNNTLQEMYYANKS